MEFIVEFFDSMLTQTFGKERGRRYLPFVGTLFLFIWFSNTIGLLPIPQFRIFGFPIPEFVEPTRDYNTPLALAVFVLFFVHGSEIRVKGLWSYIKTYFQPYFIAPFMFPMNIVGRIGQLLSIHFRLFGNIFGGAVILMLISRGWAVVIPPIVTVAVYAFFGLFVGLIQAFVFTILTVSYTAVAIWEE
jgi:F-type H+-transporting ATPase subunit a